MPAVLNGYALAPGVNLDNLFSEYDLIQALKQLYNGKSAKPNGVPNELWKVILMNSELREALLAFLNACFLQARVPKLWEIGEVVSIFKKTPENLRITDLSHY